MRLPSLPRFIPIGPIGRRRLEQVAELRAEDAKLQAARRARLTAKHATRVAMPSKQQQPTRSAKTAPAPTKRPALPTPAITVTAPVASQPAKQPVVVAPAPSNAIAANATPGRGTYANDFSRRSSYVAQTSR